MKIMNSLLALSLLLTLFFQNATHADPEDRWNLSTSPIGWLLGPNLQLDYRLDDHWTIGPQLLYADRAIGDYDFDVFSAGLKGTYYFNPAFTHSWYLQGGAGYSQVRLNYTGDDGEWSGSGHNLFASGMGGYHWFWGDFNLRLGAGVVVNSRTVVVRDRDGDRSRRGPFTPVSLGLDASLGWTF